MKRLILRIRTFYNRNHDATLTVLIMALGMLAGIQAGQDLVICTVKRARYGRDQDVERP